MAQSTSRTITTSLGTYDIPTDPQRVVAIDHRLDLEPALALGLPVIAHSLSEDIQPWVPAPEGIVYIGVPPTREAVLAQNPDLIICTDLPGTEYWPIDKLKDIAPVLPVDYEMDWKANLERMAGWLGREPRAAAFLADYDQALQAVRTRHTDAIGNRLVAAVWYEPEDGQLQFLMGTGTKNVTLAGQVLADLGGRSIDETPLGEYGLVSMENAGTILADVDAIMFDLSDGNSRREAIEAHELWGRIPAVAAGKVLWTEGIYYGGGYAAKRLIGEWDKLYALI
ncbi:ABC transporter substrate-binding protein [Devosia ginsengisoli]|uniref:ABC transporter substrate-binding protein n=1 Tax=Devosia ginsengisoli TaxID=400770 RepID=UPI0026F1D4B1|nr:ABC transporter substrate-binding protein [Devosia ginsengisoli]MCR6671586.1 ABC transporter substrate-binding protein [Devosia ginsengisoli]